MIDISEVIEYQSDYIPIVKEIVVEPEEKLSCVQYARQFVDIPYNTDAVDIKSNSYATEGGAVLFSYPNDDHIAIIVKFQGNGAWIKEANFEEPGKISERYISFGDKFIRGFYK